MAQWERVNLPATGEVVDGIFILDVGHYFLKYCEEFDCTESCNDFKCPASLLY